MATVPELCQQQREACDRMRNALHDVIRQEGEVWRRVDQKKARLAELQKQRESGDIVQPSHINHQQQVLGDLKRQVTELELAYKYHVPPNPPSQAARPQFEVYADNIPPPLPPRTTNRATHITASIPSDIGPDQWLCVRCSTVNNNLMPFCANPSCTK